MRNPIPASAIINTNMRASTIKFNFDLSVIKLSVIREKGEKDSLRRFLLSVALFRPCFLFFRVLPFVFGLRQVLLLTGKPDSSKIQLFEQRSVHGRIAVRQTG
jgi:hypothetical protein